MRFRDVMRLLQRRPFRPFRMTVTTGETFDVPHPETMFLADKFVSVPVPGPVPDPRLPPDFVWIDLLHIVHIQPLYRRPSESADLPASD